MSELQMPPEVAVEALEIVLAMEGRIPGQIDEPHQKAINEFAGSAFRSTVHQYI